MHRLNSPYDVILPSLFGLVKTALAMTEGGRFGYTDNLGPDTGGSTALPVLRVFRSCSYWMANTGAWTAAMHDRL